MGRGRCTKRDPEKYHLLLPLKHGVAASSAGVERLFSRSGETHGVKRKRMKEETLQILMYVCKNG